MIAAPFNDAKAKGYKRVSPHSVVIPPLFIKDEDGPYFFFMEIELLVCEMEGGGGGGGDASLAHQPFFLLDSQVVRIFRLKNRLIILRAVTYVIRGWMCSRVARD